MKYLSKSSITRNAILVGIALSLLPQPARTAWNFFYQGNDLYDWCGGQKKDYCVAYIMGAIDAKPNNRLFCLPNNMLVDQIAETVWAYLRDHPDIREENGATLVERALTEKFPCSKPGP